MEMPGGLARGQRGVEGIRKALDVVRDRDSDRVAQADLIDTNLDQLIYNIFHLARRDRPGEGALDDRAHVASNERIRDRVTEGVSDGAELGERFRNRHVDVLGREGLAGGGKERDAIHPAGQCSIEPAPIGNQSGKVHAFRPGDRGEELIRIRELRHPLRMDEACDFDLLGSRLNQIRDEPSLHLERNGGGLVLQAVAGADFDDPELGHVRSPRRAE